MVCEDTNHGWGSLKSASMVCVSTKHAYFNIIQYRTKITLHRWFVRTQTTGGVESEFGTGYKPAPAIVLSIQLR